MPNFRDNLACMIPYKVPACQLYIVYISMAYMIRVRLSLTSVCACVPLSSVLRRRHPQIPPRVCCFSPAVKYSEWAVARRVRRESCKTFC